MMNLDELFSNFYEFLRENKGLNSGTEENVKNISDSLDTFKSQLASNFHILASSVNMFIESYKAVVCEKNALDKELETAKNENAELQRKQNELNQHIENLNGDYFSLKNEKDALKQECDELKAKLENTEAEKSRLESELESTKKLLDEEKARLESEKKTLESELENVKGEKGQIESERKKLAEEKKDLEGKYDALLNEKETLEKTFAKFDTLRVVCSTFDSLPDNVKSGLNDIINDSMPETIVASALSPSKIQNFYEKIKMDYIKSQNAEILEKLKTIFDYMLDTISKIAPSYQKIHVNTGDPLNSKIHFDIENKESGEVSFVFLNGLMQKDEVKIKALVK